MTARRHIPVKMSSKSLRESIAIIVDGKDEKWYIEQMRDTYTKEKKTNIKITPEFPEKKSIRELFDFAERLVNQSYSHVFLIIDLDNVLKDSSETNKFQEKYTAYKKKDKSKKNKWMEKMTVIVNSPCLEFWYLLHFKRTDRFYADYEALKSDLRNSNPILKNYDKSENFYYQSPGLYIKLAPYLELAKSNSKEFDIELMNQKGFSEMYKLFHYLSNK